MAKQTEEIPDMNNCVLATDWLCNNNLIKPVPCPVCSETMMLKESKKRENLFEKFVDPFSWQCINLDCSYFKQSIEISCREGSFFKEMDTIPLGKLLHIIKFWCQDVEPNTVYLQTDIPLIDIDRVYTKCREICKLYFHFVHVKLGGPGEEVPMARYLLECKTENGSQNRLCLFMIGAKRDLTTRIGYMVLLDEEKVSDVRVYEEIENYVKSTSVVAVDDWEDLQAVASFKNGNMKFRSLLAKHERTVHAYYTRHEPAKTKIRVEYFNDPQDYLNECLWKERFFEYRFSSFFQHVKSYYQEGSK